MNDSTYYRLRAEADKVLEARLAAGGNATQVIHGSNRVLMSVCDELRYYAQCFGDTGNLTMSKKLEDLAETVFFEGHIMVEAEGRRLRKAVDDGMNQLGGILVAALGATKRG